MAVGIICEYNPFHNGHLYHINKVKEMFPDETIVLVMSGNFTQRGEISLIDKWDKTKIALEYGVDLVAELPYAFVTESADTFAKGCIEVLSELRVTKLVFGSETNDIDLLKKMVDVQLSNKEYNGLVKRYMFDGLSYPNALSNALLKITGKKINTPNDILGLCYIKEIQRQKAKINTYSIQRTTDYNSKELNGEIVSATAIREALQKGEDISKYVPSETLKYLDNPRFSEDYFPYLKYKILSEKEKLCKYHTVTEGIEHRIYSAALLSNSLDELVSKIKTKRYTYNKIMRMLMHILCNYTKKEAAEYNHIKYVRILGFTDKGREQLKKANKASYKLMTRFTKYECLMDLDFRVTSVYAAPLPLDKQNEFIRKEYKNPPIQKK